MSDYMTMLLELLPEHSQLHDLNNPLRKILDRGVGGWFDNREDIFPELFLTDATGDWLDAHGRDYGVFRQTGESDDDYRDRIIFEKLEYLTIGNLMSIYGVDFYEAMDGFNPSLNDLTTDNPYLIDWFMGVAPLNIREVLDDKFLLDNTLLWFDGESLDSIKLYNGRGVLHDYLNVYTMENCTRFFNDSNIRSVRLTLPNAVICDYLFYGSNLVKSVELNLPSCMSMSGFLGNNFGIEYVKLTIPEEIKDSVVDEVQQMRRQGYSRLSTFIVNGELIT